jgi:hypothetical protein
MEYPKQAIAQVKKVNVNTNLTTIFRLTSLTG